MMLYHLRPSVFARGAGGAAARKLKTLIPTVMIYDRRYKTGATE
jgi:hypothetical protein